MKVWHIQTWGAGTPHYLVSAETKEEAWLKVKMEWKKKYGNWEVGRYQVGQSRYAEAYAHQTINDLIEIKGLTTQTSLIVDLDEDIF